MGIKHTFSVRGAYINLLLFESWLVPFSQRERGLNVIKPNSIMGHIGLPKVYGLEYKIGQ